MIHKDGYIRHARLKSVVDGDTVRMLIDLGYRTYGDHSIRLSGITAPRIYRVDQQEHLHGIIARDYVSKWFDVHMGCGGNTHWPYIVNSLLSEAFGRFLGIIYCLQGHSLNDDILKSGHAKPYVRTENK